MSSPKRGNEAYRRGELVTVQPIDTDPWILHMQRNVTIEQRTGDGYLVRVEATSPDNHVHGPIPVSRLTPGWVEQDGTARVDRAGHRKNRGRR